MINVNKLKAAMALRGVSNKELAEKTGIDYPNLMKKLKSPTSWSVLQAQAVADYLELSRDERVEIFMEEK